MQQRDKLEVLLTLRDEATEKLGKASQAVRNHSASFRKGALMMGVAAGVLGGALTFAARAGREQDNALDALKGAVERAGGSYSDVSGRIDDALDAATKFTDYSRADAMQALGFLVSNFDDVDLAIAALPATIDRAAAANMGMESSARNVANAVNKGAGEMAETLDGLGEELKATDDKMERLAIVSRRVEGAARKNADGVTVLSSSLNDLAVELGIWEIVKKLAVEINRLGGALISKLPTGVLKAIGAALTIAFAVLITGTLVIGIGLLIAAATPLILVITAIGAAVTALVAILALSWESGMRKTKEQWEWFTGFLSGIFEWLLRTLAAIGQPIIDIMSAIWNGAFSMMDTVGEKITGAWNTVWDTVGNIVQGAHDRVVGIMTAIKDAIAGAVEVVRSAGTSLIPDINLPNLPSFRIPGLASGGIVTSPTLAMIGEGGPEAVVPLGGGGIGGGVNVNIPPSALLLMTDDSAVQGFVSTIVTQIRQELRRQHSF